MSSLHEYESFLDALDGRFYIRGSEIHVEFSVPFWIDITDCSSISELLVQTRLLTVKLIGEPGLNVQYLVERFIKLVSEFHKLKIDHRKIANSIGLVGISDVIYKCNKNPQSNTVSLRFENGVGQNAGHHFVELERDSTNLLRITRNMIGYGNHKQYTVVSKLDVVETDSHLLLFLPEPISWQFEYETSDTQHWNHGTRIALHHSFNKDLLSEIRIDVQTLMKGLSFEYSCQKSSVSNNRH